MEKQNTVTTMKLQKLVYYCQAWSLAWDDKPLFDEDFEAWANGPVNRKLYFKHRGKFVVSRDDFLTDVDTSDVFSDDEVETMDAVLGFYGDKSPHWLSELTHKEAPWQEARKGYADGAPSQEVITKDSMQVFYGGLASG